MAKVAMWEDNASLKKFGQDIVKKTYDDEVSIDWQATNDSLKDINVSLEYGSGQQKVWTSGSNTTTSNNYQLVRSASFNDVASIPYIPTKGHFSLKTSLTLDECKRLVTGDATMIPILTSRFGSLLHAYRAVASVIAESYGFGDTVKVPSGQGKALVDVPFNTNAPNWAAINSMVLPIRASRVLNCGQGYLGSTFQFTSTVDPSSPKLGSNCIVRRVGMDYRNHTCKVWFSSDGTDTVVDGAWVCLNTSAEASVPWPIGRKRAIMPRWESFYPALAALDYYGDGGQRAVNPDAFMSRQLFCADNEKNLVSLMGVLEALDYMGNTGRYRLQMSPARYRKIQAEETQAQYNWNMLSAGEGQSLNINAGRNGLTLQSMKGQLTDVLENPDFDDDEFLVEPVSSFHLASFDTVFGSLYGSGGTAKNTRGLDEKENSQISGNDLTLANGPNSLLKDGYIQVLDAEGDGWGGAKDFFVHFYGTFFNKYPAQTFYGHFGDHIDGTAFSNSWVPTYAGII